MFCGNMFPQGISHGIFFLDQNGTLGSQQIHSCKGWGVGQVGHGNVFLWLTWGWDWDHVPAQEGMHEQGGAMRFPLLKGGIT